MQQAAITIKPYSSEREYARASAATAALLARLDEPDHKPAPEQPKTEPAMEKKRDKSVGMPRANGEEWILLVDDDAVLIDVCTHMLEHLGYRVMSAQRGKEALEIFRTHAGLFDLVISDVNMPGMDGVELTHELLAIRPDLPILLYSGYTEKMNASHARAIGAGAFCLKPLPITEMAGCVRRLIDRAA